MHKRLFLFTLGLIVFFAANPAAALACACCAEPGTYFLSTYKPRTFEIDLLKEIRFMPKATLYMTEAGFDIVEGLDEIRKETETNDHGSSFNEFDLTNRFDGKQWRFEIHSRGGKKGELRVPVPVQMTKYKVDIHDEENRPNGPLLYKEYRFNGTVRAATGILRTAGVRGTKYSLVFQGRGVGCDESYNFRNWRLAIDGPRANYAFFGKLDVEAAEKAAALK